MDPPAEDVLVERERLARGAGKVEVGGGGKGHRSLQMTGLSAAFSPSSAILAKVEDKIRPLLREW
ncbi:hypothetical protein GCM10027064_17270 [Microbacterium petrolearium]